MNAQEIVNEITRRAWRFGISVLMSPTRTVDLDGRRVSGWFCEDNKQLAVATARDESRWLGTLLHEYSHLTQWVEECTVWREDNLVDFDDWLAGKPARGIRKQIEGRRELEADCERRTVRLIQELEAPIDITHYARCANAYIHFHNVIADKRKWYLPDRGPYDVPEVQAMANCTIDKDFTKTPAPLYEALLTCI